MFDDTKWRNVGSDSVGFGTPYHGAVRAQLVATNGQKLDVIALHVRPRPAFPASASAGKVADAKAGDVQRAVKLARTGVPTIVAGDFNGAATDALTVAGFTRATPKVDTLDKSGAQHLDQVWVRGGLMVRYATLFENPVSDHKAWRVGLKLLPPAATTR
jgi:endonuclease/exonuclease/phosphatase (EEP) superfamily protein YafD